jgi:hypothetical protein
MSLNFPNNPGIGSVFIDTTSGFSYEWDGTVWKSYSTLSSSQIKILDDISGSFNGSNQTFALLSNGVSISPANSQQLRIVLGGVVQSPTVDYTVAGNNIIFTTPPTSGLTFSGVSLGPAVPITVATIPDGTTTQGNLNVAGILSATGGFNIGIQSRGQDVTAGVITAINFIGAGNTFQYNSASKTIDVSIAGGGGGVSTTGVTTGFIWSNPNIVSTSQTLTNPNHNYAMIGPISVSVGATINVGAGNTFVVI